VFKESLSHSLIKLMLRFERTHTARDGTVLL